MLELTEGDPTDEACALMGLNVQARWKGHRQAAAFRQLRRAAVLMQARWRMLAARSRHLRVLRAAVRIQRYMRGWAARRTLAQQHAAATCIQVRPPSTANQTPPGMLR